ncbi:MAG TPA: ubiquinone/menaquinone biosynthesis methyltransferase [Tepidisphaeraceae bacterium]|nr:ubiquinone/menaquinone biosynthesis methyltransferase [Tepidisphaeraceae bacterium]
MSETNPTSSPAWNDQLLQNPHAVADKRSRVQKMFANIAPSYDLNNRLHSLWMDQRWRRKAVKLAGLKPTDQIVDVASGTGDLAFAFAEVLGEICRGNRGESNQVGMNDPLPTPVMGIDFTFEMLLRAQTKTPDWWFPFYRDEKDQPVLGDTWFPCAQFVNGDAQGLPLSDQSADVVSIAFGIRNVQDVPTALKEFHRVLRPGGRVIVLEFSLPTNRILRGLYNFYFRQILPRTATLISGDKTGAYKYLPESVNTFIGREQMVQMMGDAGLVEVEQFPMTFGVCVCYRGRKA